MTIYTDAIGLMDQVLAATQDMENGAVPSLCEVRSLHGKLVGVYAKLAEQVKPVYKSRVHSYLRRKIEQAEVFKRNRIDEKMTAADAEKFSLLSVGDELNREMEADADHEGHKALMQSVGRAIDFCDRVCSDIKYAEGKPPPPDHP